MVRDWGRDGWFPSGRVEDLIPQADERCDFAVRRRINNDKNG
jgi:hypothetical protein